MKKSILVKSQVKTFRKKIVPSYNELVVKVSFDDHCGNGHNTFNISAEIHRKGEYFDGADRRLVGRHFPELRGLNGWCGMTSEGPLYYIGNTTYIAGNRDCNGLLKGEFQQIATGGDKQKLNWETAVMVDGVETAIKISGMDNLEQAPTKPECDIDGVFYIPWGRIGEGKEPDLEGGRSTANWPDATLKQLQDEEALKARLPALMEEFINDIESLGLIF